MAIGFPSGKSGHIRPAGRRSFTEKDAYLSPAGDAHRAAMRGDDPRGIPDGGKGRGTNPTVQSKAVRNYGKDGSRLPNAPYGSTGSQPAPEQSDGPPSLLPVIHRQPGKLQPQQVGHATDGSGKFMRPSYPNTDRSDVTSVHRASEKRQPAHEVREALAARAKNAKPTQQVPDTNKLGKR